MIITNYRKIKKCNTYIYNNKVITVVEGSESLLNCASPEMGYPHDIFIFS